MYTENQLYRFIKQLDDSNNINIDFGILEDDGQWYILVNSCEDYDHITESWYTLYGERLDQVLFNDEYAKCCCSNNGCENLIRIQPDSYSWTPPMYDEFEGYVCNSCAKAYYTDYVLEHFCNEQKAIPRVFNPIRDLGLTKINTDSYQNGYHHDMNDSPKPIIKALNEFGIDVYFTVRSSQFYIEFDVWVKSKDENQAKQILETVNVYQGFKNDELLSKALKQASLELKEHLKNNN